MRIKQAYVGETIRPKFEKDFLERWNLKPYHDPNKPCIFFEACSSVERMLNHYSYKIVLPIHIHDYRCFGFHSLLHHMGKLFIIASKRFPEFNYPEHVKVKNFFPEIKDFSLFKPNPLGDKIYYHSTWEGYNPQCMETINRIRENVNYELITTDHKSLSNYYNESVLKENYYDKCFLNLNFTRGGSMCTSTELGLMGRKTIASDPRSNDNSAIDFYDFPSFVKYSSFENILETIEEEAKKIGTIQPSMPPHTIGEEWLDIDFWESNYLDI